MFSGGSWQALGANAASGAGIAGSPAAAVQDLTAATDGTHVAIAWTQFDATTGVREVYLREYSGGSWIERSGSGSGEGASAAAAAQFPGTLSYNAQPSLAYSGNDLFLAWQSFSDQGAAIVVTRYQGNAAPSVVSMFDTPQHPSDPQLSSGGGEVHLAWLRSPLQPQSTDVFVYRWNGTAFVEEIQGDAQPGGIGDFAKGLAEAVAVATDAQGHAVIAWQDDASGSPQIYVRENTAVDRRTFIADGTAGATLQDILANNSPGAGDVVIVRGAQSGDVTITAADAGVAIIGEPGASLSGSQDFPISNAGLVPAPAPASPVRGRERALTTPGVSFGRSSTVSSGSAALSESMASRLRTQLSTDGSTLFRLTWRTKATPFQRQYCQLVASALRTAGTGSTGSATPQAFDSSHEGVGRPPRYKAWGTPQTMDYLPGGANLEERRKKGGCSNLKDQAFGMPATGSPAGTAPAAPLSPELSRWLMGFPAEWGSCAPTEMPSSRKLRRSS